MASPSSTKRRWKRTTLARLTAQCLIMCVICSLVYLNQTIVMTPVETLISTSVKEFKATNSSEPPKKWRGVYSSKKEQDDRSQRFPSRDERVAIYMAGWYTLPCEGNDEAKVPYQFVEDTVSTSNRTLLLARELTRNHPDKTQRLFVMSSTVTNARAIWYDRDTLVGCSNPIYKAKERGYCIDVVDFMLPAIDRVNSETPGPVPPTILHFGDSSTTIAFTGPDLKKRDQWPHIPIIKKFRAAYQGGLDTIKDIMKEPCLEGPRKVRDTVLGPSQSTEDIIWRLTSRRHYSPLEDIPSVDIPWKDKMNQAVYRGALTGIGRDGFIVRHFHRNKYSETQACLLMHRCRLVYNSANSTLVDAALTGKSEFVAERIGGVQIFRQGKSKEEILKYKAIIMLEGNDVASGFKWALYSNSVVMTQAATKMSWAMEDILEPWVHYIPLNDDLTDVEEKMQWVLDNDKEAQEIAKRGSLWMKDLLMHPDSEKDDEYIYDDILRRYWAHFRLTDDLTLPEMP